MYEYTIRFLDDYTKVDEKANEMDAEGWELISVIPATYRSNGWIGVAAFFKKKKS